MLFVQFISCFIKSTREIVRLSRVERKEIIRDGAIFSPIARTDCSKPVGVTQYTNVACKLYRRSFISLLLTKSFRDSHLNDLNKDRVLDIIGGQKNK